MLSPLLRTVTTIHLCNLLHLAQATTIDQDDSSHPVYALPVLTCPQTPVLSVLLSLCTNSSLKCKQCVSFHDWIISLSTMSSRFVHVEEGSETDCVSICPLVDAGCCNPLAAVHSEQDSVSRSFGNIPRCGIAGLCDNHF